MHYHFLLQAHTGSFFKIKIRNVNHELASAFYFLSKWLEPLETKNTGKNDQAFDQAAIKKFA